MISRTPTTCQERHHSTEQQLAHARPLYHIDTLPRRVLTAVRAAALGSVRTAPVTRHLTPPRPPDRPHYACCLVGSRVVRPPNAQIVSRTPRTQRSTPIRSASAASARPPRIHLNPLSRATRSREHPMTTECCPNMNDSPATFRATPDDRTAAPLRTPPALHASTNARERRVR